MTKPYLEQIKGVKAGFHEGCGRREVVGGRSPVCQGQIGLYHIAHRLEHFTLMLLLLLLLLQAAQPLHKSTSCIKEYEKITPLEKLSTREVDGNRYICLTVSHVEEAYVLCFKGGHHIKT